MTPSPITSRRALRTEQSAPHARTGSKVIKVLAKVGDHLLTLTAFLGVLSLLVAAASAANLIAPLVVTSNSMQPTFSAGDLIIARPVEASSVKVGDIVTVPRVDGVLVTHRVSRILPTVQGVSLAMKGDANESEDSEIYQSQQVRVPVVIIPNVGWVVASLSNMKFVIATGFAMIMFVWLLWSPGKSKTKKRKHSK